MSERKIRLYTQKTARKLLGVSNPKFYKFVEQGLIKKVVLEGEDIGRYNADDVDTLAEKFKRDREQYVIDEK